MQTKPYSWRLFALDIVMLCVTRGYWLIWICAREIRRQW